MSKNKDDIELLHEYGIYTPTKTLMITGEVCEVMYENVIANLHILDSTTGAITIKLNSEGGDVVAGRAIYDAIRNCKNEVRCIVYGQASSAASFILQAADIRVISDNAYLMLHVGEEGHPENHPRNIEKWHKFNRDLEAWMEDVYLKKIKEKKKRFTRNQLKSMLQWDKILKPKEALELGLVDAIGEIQ
jgi:ATP-dependent protease ClpP protease subunit